MHIKTKNKLDRAQSIVGDDLFLLYLMTINGVSQLPHWTSQYVLLELIPSVLAFVIFLTV